MPPTAPPPAKWTRTARRRLAGNAYPAGRGWAQLVLLVLVIVALVALAAAFRGQAERASTGAARNQAVIDTRATADVIGQVSEAIETVLSYDYTKLDENQRVAHDVITGGYIAEYDAAFAGIRKSATERKAVVKATVLVAGVKQLGPDRAELIAAMSLETTESGAPGGVVAVADRVDGRWKIAQLDLL